MNCIIADNHNDQGWIIAFKWLKTIKSSVINNHPRKFKKLIFTDKKIKDRNLFHLKGDRHSLEKFNLYCQLGLEKFNLGVK